MITSEEYEIRRQLVHFAQLLESSGLSGGTSGNLSARCGDTVLITPSATPYAALSPQHIVALRADGTPLPEQLLPPSSEWRFHCDLYRHRPEIESVVHAHPPACTALACTDRGIPAFHYMVAIAGGSEIPIANYALFGSADLSDNIQKAIGSLNACLLANHGMIALGRSVSQAFNLALEVEVLADQYSRALALGNVVLLNDEEMQQVREQFQHYGQRY